MARTTCAIHTFVTWLEDASIPSRVIDEVMGHVGTKRERAQDASRYVPNWDQAKPQVTVVAHDDTSLPAPQGTQEGTDAKLA